MTRGIERYKWREFIFDELWPVLEWRQSKGHEIDKAVHDIKGVYVGVFVSDGIPKGVNQEHSVLSA